MTDTGFSWSEFFTKLLESRFINFALSLMLAYQIAAETSPGFIAAMVAVLVINAWVVMDKLLSSTWGRY